MLTMTDSEQRAESLRGTDWVNQGLCTSRPATIPKVTFRISRPAANRAQTLALRPLASLRMASAVVVKGCVERMSVRSAGS